MTEDKKPTYKLPNGKVVDVEDVTMAMENASWEHYADPHNPQLG